MAIVYKLTSPSGKIYIGVNCKPRFSDRLAVHNWAAKNGAKTKIANAIRKYGLHNFKKEILFEGLDNECYSKEIELIKQFDSIKTGYNISTGGEHGTSGWVPTLEQRTHQSIKMSNVVRTKEWRKNISNALLGREFTDEWKQHMANSQLKYVYEIIFPNNKIEQISNLREFCRKHNLDSGYMHKIANKIPYYHSHKGYKVNIIGEVNI
jgi:group I intron endonuclease